MILDLQRRLHEVGRIRIGQQVTTKNGTHPAKLETFRLTSPDQRKIRAAANLYGGRPQPWNAPAGPQHEVITEVDTLPILIPPADMALSMWYELWSAGGCQRRCDGAQETISDGPCLCDPEQRECAIHTRLSVLLRDLPGVGLWRLDTQGFYAAHEIQGAVDILSMAAGTGQMLPAALRLEQRMTKRPGQGTRRFAVPVLDIEVPPGQLIAGTVDLTPCEDMPAALPAAPLTPVPDTGTRPSIAEQIAPPTPRRRSAQPVPATGLAPRRVDQLPKTAGVGPDPSPTARETTPGPAPAQDDDTLDLAGYTQRQTELNTAAATPQTTPAPRGGERPAPAREDLPRQASGDVAGQPPPKTMADLTPDQPDPPINKSQLTKLHTLLSNLGITNRNDYHAICSHILGYQVETTKNLTRNEARQLIDTLDGWTLDPDADGLIREILNTAALAQDALNEQDNDDE